MTRRIAYMMTRFPKVTETFILREMDELHALGWEVEVFALAHEHGAVSHAGVEAYLRRAHFARQRPCSTLGANVRALVKRPSGYLGMLAQTIRYTWRSPRFLVRALIAFPFAAQWADIIRMRGVDHIHAHFATHAAYVAYVISIMTGVPYSFTAHAHDIFLNRTMLGEKIARASAVVTISEYNRRLLAEWFPDAKGKISVIRCGIDTNQFVGDGGEPTASDASSMRIVCIARLKEMKGVIYLAQACHELRLRNIPFTCTLVGDGPDRRMISDYLMRHDLLDHVTLAGWLPGAQVAETLREADVFVLPSVVARDGSMEGIPNVLMEAMSSQLPVISTTISGIPELVSTGFDGLLVPPNDALALADALSYLFAHPEERRAMGRAGRARVLADYDLHKNTRVKAELFARLSMQERGKVTAV